MDLQVERPINLLEFELSKKPIRFTVEYWNGSTWLAITPRTDIENIFRVHYIDSALSWDNIEVNFEVVVTNKLKITFIRDSKLWPLESSPSFPWSI